ncbi:MAG: hypothetical protein L6R38_006157 [Xanthoria sp. 2 TBL-2021]|nr:MAG: hypothetical protein L6R38_006157 [Xanthoria sp. 2 TBL-2021]
MGKAWGGPSRLYGARRVASELPWYSTGSGDDDTEEGEADGQVQEREHDEEEDEEEERRRSWAKLLDQQIAVLIARRDQLLQDPSPPSIGHATAVNPMIQEGTVQVTPPVLSINAPQFERERVYNEREPLIDCKLENANMEIYLSRKELIKQIDDLATLEFNLGTVVLDGEFGYNVKRTIELWRGYVARYFMWMCAEQATALECRYARIFTQGGQTPEDRRAESSPPRRCGFCRREICQGRTPPATDCRCSGARKRFDAASAAGLVSNLWADPGSPGSESSENHSSQSPSTRAGQEDGMTGPDGESEGHIAAPVQPTVTENEETADGDTSMSDALTSPSVRTPIQRAALHRLARYREDPHEELETIADQNMDDEDSVMSNTPTTLLQAPSLQRAKLMRLARGR